MARPKYDYKPGIVYVSPSQIQTKRDCRRLWGYKYLDKIRAPQKPTQLFGLEGHDRAEQWLKNGAFVGEDDVGMVVQQGIKPGYMPTPSPDLLIEQCIEIPLLDGKAMMVGYMDCGVRPVMGVGGDPNEPPIVHDWKFTKDLRWAMTEDELKVDVQSVSYSMWALDAFEVDEAFARWVYFCGRINRKSGDGRPRTPRGVKKTEHLFTRGEILDRWGEVLEDVREIVHMREQFKTAAEVPPNEMHCDAYGGCDHREYCPLSKDVGLGAAFAQYDRTHKQLTRRDNETIDAPQTTESKKMSSSGLSLMEALEQGKTPAPAAAPAAETPAMFQAQPAAAPPAAAAEVAPPVAAAPPAAAAETPAMFQTQPAAAPPAAAPPVAAAPPAAAAEVAPPAMFAATAGGVPAMFQTQPAAAAPPVEVAPPAAAPPVAAAPPATVDATPAMFQAQAAAAAPLQQPAPVDVAAAQAQQGATGLNPPGDFAAAAAAEAAKRAEAAAKKEATAAAPAEKPKRKRRTKAEMEAAKVAEVPAEVPAAAAPAEVPAAGPGHFVVAYNALPVTAGNGFGQVVHLGDLLAPLLEHIATNHRCKDHPEGVAHWNMIEFGYGKSILAYEFAKYLDSVSFDGVLVVDGDTPEGLAVKDILVRRADLVVQGVR
ncbi:MAG: hypothetical protein ACTSX8_10615 [Alphaproteobacteria bacterium]